MMSKWKQPPGFGQPNPAQPANIPATPEEAAVQESLQAADATIARLEAELAACERAERTEAAGCRQGDATNAAGTLAGGNEVYIIGDFAGPDPIVDIVSDAFAYHALTASGKVWAWGYSSDGELGTGKEYANPTPALVLFGEPIRQIFAATRGYYDMAIARSGNIYSWGQGSNGQLLQVPIYGTDDIFQYSPLNVSASLPTFLRPGETITAFYPAGQSNYFLTSEGRVMYAGRGDNCAPAYNASSDILYPEDITPYLPLTGGERVIRIIPGYGRAIALTDHGHAYSWGDNFQGATGLGDIGTPICTPMDLATNLPLAPGEYIVGGDSSAYYATVVWTNLGNLYLLGTPSYDALGNPRDTPYYTPLLITDDVVSASSGDYLMLIVRDGGHSLWVMGTNDGSGMGDGTTDPQLFPHDITPYLHLAAGETIARVAVISDSSAGTGAILTSQGRVLTFGRGDYGQLGNGSLADEYAPIDITPYLTTTGTYIPAIYFGDQPATSFQVISDHLIRVTVPPGTHLGPVDITLTGNAPQRLPSAYEYVAEICVI
jgi:alpha-tubulin suppressor-like RCC1 family protein